MREQIDNVFTAHMSGGVSKQQCRLHYSAATILRRSLDRVTTESRSSHDQVSTEYRPTLGRDSKLSLGRDRVSAETQSDTESDSGSQ